MRRGSLITVLLVAACRHRAAAPPLVAASDPPPLNLTWEEQIACAADLLRAAGYDVSQDSAGVSAERHGATISLDPHVSALNEVYISRSAEPGGQALVLNFTAATTSERRRARIVAMSFELHEVRPGEGSSYMLGAPPSGDVQTVAYRVQRECGRQ